MNLKVTTGLLLASSLMLTGCKDNFMDLGGRVTSVTGQIQMSDKNGPIFVDAGATAKGARASFYKDGKKAGISVTIRDYPGKLSFALDQDPKELKAQVEQSNAHATSAAAQATVDYVGGNVEAVNESYQTTGSCVYGQETHWVCNHWAPQNRDGCHNSQNCDWDHGGGHYDPPHHDECHYETYYTYGTAYYRNLS